MKYVPLQKLMLVAGLLFVIIFGSFSWAEKMPQSALETAMAGEHRSADNKARDQFRHPSETLTFFGIKPDMTVVEIWPGSGWYMEILAPYLKNKGVYYAAGFEKNGSSEYYTKNVKKLQTKIDASPDIYSKVLVTELKVPEKVDVAPAGSADAVLTFRNIHNWMRVEGQVEQMFAVFF